MNQNELMNYVSEMNLQGEQLQWVNSALLKWVKNSTEVDQSAIEHLIDFLASDEAPQKMIRMSVEQALEKAEQWTKSQQKKGKHIEETEADTTTLMTFSDGGKIVELIGENAFRREGFLMSHCAGSMSKSGYKIYSYRDGKNMPHATFQVSKNGDEFLQIKGKGNGPIHPKYIDIVIEFLTIIGFKVREQEMRNLGYYYVPSRLRPIMEQVVPNPEGITLDEKFYVYGNQR